MIKLVAAAAVLAGVGFGSAFAADLSATAVPAAAPVANDFLSRLYVEGYAGIRLANTLDWDFNPYDLAQGTTFGGAIGLDTRIPGLSFDVDLMQVNSYYICCGSDDVLNSTSLMADVNYELPLGKTFGVFAGAGIGEIWLNYDHYYKGSGPGYQLKAGVSAALTPQLSLFGEYKYQSAFNDIETSYWPIEYHTNSILGGVRFNFR
jgi:opacity protein-like surface antigen